MEEDKIGLEKQGVEVVAGRGHQEVEVPGGSDTGEEEGHKRDAEADGKQQELDHEDGCGRVQLASLANNLSLRSRERGGGA